MKKIYVITLHGCDDSTVFRLELGDHQYALLKNIEQISKEKSEYECMPFLEIQEQK